MKIYKSCHCRFCRRQSQGGTTRKESRNMAHRKFRRISKELIRYENYEPPIISTGYLD
jgi:hypothetical protein